jgi:putative endonuclease
MNKGYMYILECADGSYYTGSTKDLERRLAQHQAGEGANHTKKRLPVKLVYYEEFQRIDDAFYREKQVQGWSRKKKEALMNGVTDELKILAECMNESHYKNRASASLSPQNMGTVEQEKKVVERSRNHRDDNLKGLRYE